MDPLVSVILPTRNRPQLLKQAVESALNQTYQNLEVIILNDAGEDLQEILDAFKDKRIVYLKHASQKGVSAARNTALKQAKGFYIAYLDDDDLYYSNHIQTLVQAMQNKGYPVAYTDVQDVIRKNINGSFVVYKKQTRSHALTPDLLLVDGKIPPLCLMHEKSCLERTGLFDETLTHYEDWDLYIRLSRHFAFLHVPCITSEYSKTEGYEQTVTSWYGSFLDSLQRIYARYWNYCQEKPDLKLVQENRLESMQNCCFQQLEEIDDEQIRHFQPARILAKIAESSLALGQKAIRGARALAGYLAQRLQNEGEIWCIYARLCRLLGDSRSALIAIKRASDYLETPQVAREFYFILAQAGEDEQAAQIRCYLSDKQTSLLSAEPLDLDYFDEGLARALLCLFQSVNTHSVLDLGCGINEYATLLMAREFYLEKDRKKPVEWVLNLKADEESFIKIRDCSCSKGIILSPSMPEKKKQQQISESRKGQIKQVFAQLGYVHNEGIEKQLRERASLAWFKENLFVFTKVF